MVRTYFYTTFFLCLLSYGAEQIFTSDINLRGNSLRQVNKVTKPNGFPYEWTEIQYVDGVSNAVASASVSRDNILGNYLSNYVVFASNVVASASVSRDNILGNYLSNYVMFASNAVASASVSRDNILGNYLSNYVDSVELRSYISPGSDGKIKTNGISLLAYDGASVTNLIYAYAEADDSMVKNAIIELKARTYGSIEGTQRTGIVSVAGSKIINVDSPVLDNDAANKMYTDITSNNIVLAAKNYVDLRKTIAWPKMWSDSTVLYPYNTHIATMRMRPANYDYSGELNSIIVPANKLLIVKYNMINDISATNIGIRHTLYFYNLTNLYYSEDFGIYSYTVNNYFGDSFIGCGFCTYSLWASNIVETHDKITSFQMGRVVNDNNTSTSYLYNLEYWLE
jgi:hypothetical protein